MLPQAIIKQAKEKGLDIIGICDHNCAKNSSAVKKAGEKEGVVVLEGMEITSREEAHITAFFNKPRSLEKMQEIVSGNLYGKNQGKVQGLAAATNLSVDKIVSLVHDLHGMAIAAHIDRQVFGIIAQLGFIPEGLEFDALELSPNYNPDKLVEYIKYNLPLVTFSDAHYLADIGKVATGFLLEEPSFSEIKLALQGAKGRKISVIASPLRGSQ